MVIGKGYKAHPTLAILMQGLLACRGNYDYSVDGVVGRGTEACIKWKLSTNLCFSLSVIIVFPHFKINFFYRFCQVACFRES